MENILPRICYVLGGEEDPLYINEEFRVTNRTSIYRIADDGTFQYRDKTMEFFAFCKSDTIFALINGIQRIIREPQALLRDPEVQKAMTQVLIDNIK
jgi:hypothetical protein